MAFRQLLQSDLAGQARTLADDIIESGSAGIHLVVDQLEGEFILLGQLIAGDLQALPDALLALGAAAAQAALQLLGGGGQQEDGGGTGIHAADIGRAMHIDDHDHQLARVQPLVDLFLQGACYKAEDGAVMYRSAQYAAKYGTVNKKKTEDGTEEEAKDEVLVRANGIPTYFAADIAYHYNKLATRGFAKAIDVWGADHHGHVARMKGAMDAIGLNGEDLDVVLMQMVNLMRDGQPVRMSKRTGNAITLTDLLEEVPIDSARFLFNMHDAGSGIDFDLDQAVKTDNDNPVYYVQYAHARICSILKKMESEGVQFAGAEHIDATLLTEPSEMDLIRMLAAFPQEIVMAAEKYDPSRINRFVIDLASAFHRFYGNCRIQGADPAVQQARLALCIGVKNVIFNVLTMFKINVPEKM